MFKTEAVIVDTNTWKVYNKYQSLRAARGAKTRMGLPEKYEPMSLSDYFEGDAEVEVKHLLTGAPIMIPRSQVATCCDPSTERYFSM